jgi:hypothetical protein
LVSVLCQMNPVQTNPSFLLNSILLYSTVRYLWWSRFSGHSSKILLFLFLPMCAIKPTLSHCHWLYHFNYIWWKVQVMKLLIMQILSILLQLEFFGPNILLSTLFSNTLNLCSSFNIKRKVITLTVVIIGGYRCYQHHKKCYPIFSSEG